MPPSPPSASRPQTLNFITSNAHKLAEVQAILLSTSPSPSSSSTTQPANQQNVGVGVGVEAKVEAKVDVHLKSQAIDDVPEIQGSLEEIAREKCRGAAGRVQGPVLTEDTALEFRALNGLPGPYIKHFLNALGAPGLVTLLSGFPDKIATAICTFAYCAGPGEEVLLFQGRTEGTIVEPRGSAKFGYDPIFEYEGKTYAEMGSDAKNRISHRGRALEKLRAWLAETPAS